MSSAPALSWRCMNSSCGSPAPAAGGGEWRKGWALRSGGFATLCESCGAAYEQLMFCDIFHQKETGWRECFYCGKRFHCGCVVSKYMFELLDGGGVQCINCMKKSELHSNQQTSIDKIDETTETGQSSVLVKQREQDTGANQIKWEQQSLTIRDIVKMPCMAKNQTPIGILQGNKKEEDKNTIADNMAYESLPEARLSINLGIAHDGNKLDAKSLTEGPLLLSPAAPFGEGREFTSALSPLYQKQHARQLLTKPMKTEGADFDLMKDFLPCMRVARPPAELRSRNQLLPRYWPRITDQELQQISGDSNSTIVPLFEKVLSASDAGRIGRLVLPKACAEAYFPPISQPEGRPLTIQDARGKEWHFQFRFWPNNNSRMYVLEGVTPCIQSLQLQAGDTVTFSRVEPGGKLIMGYRKATNTVTMPDSQISAMANAGLVNKGFFSSANENLAIMSGYSGFLQSLKGSADLHTNSAGEHANLSDGEFSWLKADNIRGKVDDESVPLWHKRSRNISSRNQRFLMECDDAFELNMTWDEAQELLRPSPSAIPSVVIIEDYEIEEYEDPPVFGKRTIFTVQSSGEQDQWIQCDACSRWRRLPLHVVIASKWTCADNSWDMKYSTCSAPDELSPREVQSMILQYEDVRRRRSNGSLKRNFEDLDTGLDTLANVSVIGQATVSVATTTKHPRHRPGCTCIVCIQPPSGKGPKHSPSCTCNVCMTVRRRFKTLMMRKKQRQSEREEAEAHKRSTWVVTKEETEGSSLVRSAQNSEAVMNKGPIDLNFHPGRDYEQHGGSGTPRGGAMLNLLEAASRPLENYLRQNNLNSLTVEQGSSSTATLATAGESEERTSNEGRLSSVDRDNGTPDEACGTQKAANESGS